LYCPRRVRRNDCRTRHRGLPWLALKAAVFIEPGRIALADKPIPDVGPRDALVRVTTTTICGTDVHILKGEYPIARGLTVGHEPVGVIEKPEARSRATRSASA